MSKTDPCVAICRFDGRTGWCVGCGLTVPEIRAWRKMKPHARGKVERELPRRIQKIDGRGDTKR